MLLRFSFSSNNNNIVQNYNNQKLLAVNKLNQIKTLKFLKIKIYNNKNNQYKSRDLMLIIINQKNLRVVRTMEKRYF